MLLIGVIEDFADRVSGNEPWTTYISATESPISMVKFMTCLEFRSWAAGAQVMMISSEILSRIGIKTTRTTHIKEQFGIADRVD